MKLFVTKETCKSHTCNTKQQASYVTKEDPVYEAIMKQWQVNIWWLYLF